MEGSYSKYFVIVIILLVLIFSINLLPYFHIYDESIFVPSDILEKHQGLISLVGIIAAILIFWGTIRKQNKDREREFNQRVHTACELIEQEILQIKNGIYYGYTVIKDKDPPLLMFFLTMMDTKVYYIQVYFPILEKILKI